LLRLESLEERTTPSVDSLVYASYFGGNGSAGVTGVATDATGDIYLCGRTSSTTFPGFSGPLAPQAQGFVAKFDPTGTTLSWAQVIDTDTSGVRAIAVDSSGNVYVTGSTGFTGVATPGSAQSSYGGEGDAFAAKLDGQTGAIDWATYIGGQFVDVGTGIAVNAADDVWVTGWTESADFPTHNPLSGQASLESNSGTDAFLTEISPDGAHFLYSTYLGGQQDGLYDGNGATPTEANAIALDSTGNVYLTGYTHAADFPTVNAFQSVKGFSENVFVTEIKSDGSQILYSTFLSDPNQKSGNGGGDNVGYGIAVDSSGNILVTGATTSLHFPLKNAFQKTIDRGVPDVEDAFVTKLDPNTMGSAQLVYSTYDGGTATDFGQAIAVDSSGDAYVVGFAESAGTFPSLRAIQSNQVSSCEFVAGFSSTGSILFNTKFGQSGSGYGNEDTPLGAVVTVSPFGSVVFGGDYAETALHATANAYQRTFPDPGSTDSGYFAMLAGKPTKSFHGVDSDGDVYSVTLTGPGAIDVIQTTSGTSTGPIHAIYLEGTSSKSSVLSIAVTTKVGDGFVNVGSVTGPGLERIAASTADLTGAGIDLTGKLGALTIHDVSSGASILAAGPATQSTSILAHVIGNSTTIDVGGNLSLLKAASIGTATITAPHLTTLSVTGDATNSIAGDLSAAITLTGTGTALGTAFIAGEVDGANIEVRSGSVTTFKASEFVNTTLYLGSTGTLTPGQHLRTFTVTGITGSSAPAFVNSNVSAAIVGTVTLASVQTDNNGTKFGIDASVLIAAVRMSNPAFTYNPKKPTPQGIGDFEVVLG
jgi:hypothetical protein